MDQTLHQMLTDMHKNEQVITGIQQNLKQIVSTSGSIHFARTAGNQQKMLQKQDMYLQPSVQPLDQPILPDLDKEQQPVQNQTFDPKQLYNLNYPTSCQIQLHKSHSGYLKLKEIEDQNQLQEKDLQKVIQQIIEPNVPSLNNTKNMKKNSNAVKKMGRIILNNLRFFAIKGQQNQGVQKMQHLLKLRAKDRYKPKDIRDGFNTSHLEALFSDCSPQTSSHNLRAAKRLFEKKLRTQIFSSAQIRQDNQLLYLNTLKCSALRFTNKKLAVRLQLSQNR